MLNLIGLLALKQMHLFCLELSWLVFFPPPLGFWLLGPVQPTACFCFIKCLQGAVMLMRTRGQYPDFFPTTLRPISQKWLLKGFSRAWWLRTHKINCRWCTTDVIYCCHNFLAKTYLILLVQNNITLNNDTTKWTKELHIKQIKILHSEYVQLTREICCSICMHLYICMYTCIWIWGPYLQVWKIKSA